MELPLLIKLGVLVMTAVAAWELRDRLKNRDRKIDARISDAVLNAALVIQGPDGPIRYAATLENRDQGYELAISTDASGGDPLVTRETFSSKNEVDMYLRENTLFRLGDFVRHAQCGTRSAANTGSRLVDGFGHPPYEGSTPTEQLA
jgi:hypothetical protein